MSTALYRLAVAMVVIVSALLATPSSAGAQTTQPAPVAPKILLYNAMPQPPRSPIPLPGEKFDRPISLAIARPAPRESVPTTQPAPVGDVIPWADAPKHMGKTITVEGTIVDTHKTRAGDVCFLNFVKNDRSSFYLIMWKENFDKFPDSPERYFLNKKVRCTGEVSDNKGRPQIKVNDARQIWVVE
jgi:hypothetical protein